MILENDCIINILNAKFIFFMTFNKAKFLSLFLKLCCNKYITKWHNNVVKHVDLLLIIKLKCNYFTYCRKSFIL